MNKLPAITIQYGHRQYELPYNIYLISKDNGRKIKSECLNRSERRLLTKTFCDIYKHKKLAKYLLNKTQTFSRFIKFSKKKISRTKRYHIYLESLIISKGFFSYITQTKEDLSKLFKRYEKVRNLKYIISDLDEVFIYDITKKGNSIRRKIRDGIYKNVEVKNFDNESEIVNIRISQGAIYINSEKMLRYMNRKNTLWLYQNELVTRNDFEDFKKCLAEYFEEINISNNTWGEYIDEKVKRMIQYTNDNTLEDMQKEYEAVRVAKLKQIQNG